MMKIRKPRNGDEKDIAELSRQFWEVHTGIYPLLEPAKKLTIKEHIKGAKKMIKNKKKDEFVFVVEQDNKVIAIMELKIEKNDSFFKNKRYGYLDSITIHKDYRKRGVARLLTKFALGFFKEKGIRYVVGKVFVENKVARDSWRKMGFKEKSVNLFKEI